MYEYDLAGRLIKVYSSTAVWTLNNGTSSGASIPIDPYDFDSYPDLPVYEIENDWMSVLYRFRLVPLAGTELDFALTYGDNNVYYGVCFEDPQYGGCVRDGAVSHDTLGYSGYFDYLVDMGNGLEPLERFDVINTSFESVSYQFSLYTDYYVTCGNTVVASVGAAMDEADELHIYLFIEEGYFDFSAYVMEPYSLASTTETLITSYTYDANGNRIGMANANGTSTVYTYNKANLLTSVQNLNGDTVLSSHSYTYYLDGNIRSEIENGAAIVYEYDDLGRLTREERQSGIHAGTVLYTYDNRGNRATKCYETDTTAYTYDLNNRLISETEAGVATVYTYDANGNTLTVTKGGSLCHSYTYGLFGTQDSHTSDGVTYLSYTYRPDGLRHSIGSTVHLWDGANIVADVKDSDVTVYFRGINLIYADEDGTKEYYHFNAHGDVIALTNASGTKTKSYTYSAFGVEYNRDIWDENPFRYCGEYYDTVTDTIYWRLGQYDAKIGTTTQKNGGDYTTFSLKHRPYVTIGFQMIPREDCFEEYLDVEIMLPDDPVESPDDNISNVEEPYQFVFNPSLNPDFDEWNVKTKDNKTQLCTNCYAYAFNMKKNPLTNDYFPSGGLRLGMLSGLIEYHEDGEPLDPKMNYWYFTDARKDELIEIINADLSMVGLQIEPYDPNIHQSGGYCVALALCTKPKYYTDYEGVYMDSDFHWARQNADGTWTHKLGKSEADVFLSECTVDEQMLKNKMKALGYDTFVNIFYVSCLK